MESDSSGDRRQARERIAKLIENPSQGETLLPGVLGSLDSEDHYLRLCAACGICLAATAAPDLLPYLVRRLIDRLHDDDDTRGEAVFAFEYLASQYPTEVDDVLQEIREETDNEPLSYTRTGGYRRSNIYSPSIGNRDVGRTRVAGEGQSPGPQQVYSDDDEREEVERGEETDAERWVLEDPDEEGRMGAESDRERSVEERADLDIDADLLERLVVESAFDDITILAERETDGFGDVYRSLAVARGTERAVELRLFDRPEENQGFDEYLSVALDQWNRVSAANHVVSLYDRGVRPRPWAAVAYTDLTLVDRGRLDLSEALWNGIILARTISTLHDNGVVHAGLDPHSVAYPGNMLSDEQRQVPLLDHVGLVDAFRFYFDPARCLDPRYAAPEYFDVRFGGVDHATDIYQLGSTLYRLFTGYPPYTGDFDEIQAAVQNGSMVPPSERVETLPGSVDEIISKATATQKLTRYETADQVEQDLLQLREQVLKDGD